MLLPVLSDATTIVTEVAADIIPEPLFRFYAERSDFNEETVHDEHYCRPVDLKPYS